MDEIRGQQSHTIKGYCPKAQFTHVSSEGNPADLPSRGCYASELRRHSQKLWLYAPDWLGKTIPEQPEVLETTQEMKRVALTTKTKTQGQKKRSTDSSIVKIEEKYWVRFVIGLRLLRSSMKSENKSIVSGPQLCSVL